MKEWPDWKPSSQAIYFKVKSLSALPVLPVATKTRGVRFPQGHSTERIRLSLRSRSLCAVRCAWTPPRQSVQKNKHRHQEVTEKLYFDTAWNALETFYIRMLGKEKKKKESNGCGFDSGDPPEKCIGAKTISCAVMSTDELVNVYSTCAWKLIIQEDKRVSCCRITVAYGQWGSHVKSACQASDRDTLVTVCHRQHTLSKALKSIFSFMSSEMQSSWSFWFRWTHEAG